MQTLCSAYHWSLSDALKLTLPQIIMLNHASWADHENGQRRYEAKKKWEEQREIDDPRIPEYGNRRLSEVQEDPELLESYLSSDWSGL